MKELRATAAILAISILAGALFWVAIPRTRPPHPATPQRVDDHGYVGSGACQSCHPAEHQSWHSTYHRSMTRRANALGWDGDRAPRLPITLQLYDRDFRLSGGRALVSYRGPDLHVVGRRLSAIARSRDVPAGSKLDLSRAAFREAPEVERELVLVTGSHHYLAFWIEGGKDAELRQLPFVYLLDEGRFLPRKDAFLQPPEALPHVARWNANCIQCHAVAGQARQTEGYDEISGEFWERYDTVVAEEGISCEACHGPARSHVEHYRDPLARVRDRSSHDAREIFVPDHEAGPSGSAACGQCHSYFVAEDPETWWTSGFTTNFSAGQSLEESRTVLSLNGLSRREQRARQSLDQDLRSIFWDDGSIMVGGREYNGLTKSPCYLKGSGDKQLSCAHCHSMHSADPDKQIRPDRAGDEMCTTCHGDIDAGHARHPQDSVGARCTGCHMPRTSYALLHGIPSHQISSPSPRLDGPPHACALCHVDKSKDWILTELSEGWGLSEESSHPARYDSIPWAVHQALSGHAAQRALFSYALGTDESVQAAGTAVALHILPRLREDPYSAVRLIAERSLRRVQGRTRHPAGALPDQLDEAALTHLEKFRDNAPITISE